MEYIQRLSRTPTKKYACKDRFMPEAYSSIYKKISITPDKNMYRRLSRVSNGFTEGDRMNSPRASMCGGLQQTDPMSPVRRKTSIQSSSVQTTTSGNRRLPTNPNHVVKLNNIPSDFYISPLDWSRNNIIAFATIDKVLFFNPKTMESHEPKNICKDVISLKFNNRGDKLFLGCLEGEIMLYDMKVNQVYYENDLFKCSVLSIDWRNNTIITGGRDGNMALIDIREEEPAIQIKNAHLEEICSVKLQPETSLFATCGNDCVVKIWDQRRFDEPLTKYSEHEAAIRAVDWCPTSKNIIATGGGTADKTIKMWDINTGNTIKSIDTGSQVCNLYWNSEYDEIFTTHGYSQNHLAIWKGSDLSPVASFHNHKQRILYMCHSPDETTVATAAPDDSLQIWKMFPQKNVPISQSLLFLR